MNEENSFSEDLRSIVVELHSLLTDQGQEKINEVKKLIMEKINTPNEKNEKQQ